MATSVSTRVLSCIVLDKSGTKTTDHHKTDKQVSASHVTAT